MTQAVRRPALAQRQSVLQGWALCAAAPGTATTPARIDSIADERWLQLAAPATVAAALRAAGQWSLDGPARRFDAEDWCYRTAFQVDDAAPGEGWWLGFDGLAGVADVWLDGELLLHSENSFLRHERPIAPGPHTLLLRFHALDGLLAQRRARPRWRAPMVEHQQLRWFRTTLLGRTPGWSPPAAPVGLWKDVWLERRVDAAGFAAPTLAVRVTDDGDGELEVHCPAGLVGSAGERVLLELERGGTVHRAALSSGEAGGKLHGVLRVPRVERWWPHTHGEPALYAASLLLQAPGAGELSRLPLGRVGFRTLALDTRDGGFSLRVNDVPVFCRGACWMPLDVVGLRATPADYRTAVAQVCDAGMNMLRVSGATVYEDSAFFDACDAAGVLVWQDLMFANMDYPAQDADFMASVEAEVGQQLAQWQARPCLAVVCGNCEVEQQAAMWGAPRELWQPELFHGTLRRQVEQALPDVPYWPSSAHGGAFPHQSDAGSSSYYGVGAYLRPEGDVRRADVRFATECLGFANVPENAAIARMPGGAALRVHHPAWKARAPRDLGAGWDFEDVRDHYLATLFEIDPLRCRYADHERYLALSRVVTGELMAGAFAEWRRPGSRCGGALVWFLRDLWAGAGWGLVDDAGVPKACFHQLRRALQPVALSITDEGGNGLVAHVVNERQQALGGELLIGLFGPTDALVAQARRPLQIGGRGAVSLALAESLDGFVDLSQAYRFGPAAVTLVHVRLLSADGTELAEAFHFPAGRPAAVRRDLGLTATLVPLDEGRFEVVLGSAAMAWSVHLELAGYVCDDNHFHLAPGARRRIVARPLGGAADRVPRGSVTALNADRVLSLRAAP